MDENITMESHKIFWNYLQYSEKYKKTCEDIKNNPAILNDIELWLNADSNMTFGTAFGFHFFYKLFGNIYCTSFNSWWNENKEEILNPNQRQIVFDYSEVIQDDIDVVLRWFMDNNDREPTLHEFIHYFISYFQTTPSIYIKVDLHDSLSNLKKSVEDLFVKKVKNSVVYQTMTSIYYDKRRKHLPLCLPTTLRKIDNLKVNLRVYELREKGFKWRQLIEMISKESRDHRHDSYVNVIDKRRYHFYLDSAVKILENIDNGRFPGKYVEKFVP